MSIAHNHCKEGERATIVKMTYWTESIIPFSHRGLNSNLGTNSSWIIFAVTLIRSIMLLVHLAPVLLGQMGVWQNWQGKTIFPHLAFSTRCLVTGMILTGKVATYRHMYWAEPKEPTQFGSVTGSEIQNLSVATLLFISVCHPFILPFRSNMESRKLNSTAGQRP